MTDTMMIAGAQMVSVSRLRCLNVFTIQTQRLKYLSFVKIIEFLII